MQRRARWGIGAVLAAAAVVAAGAGVTPTHAAGRGGRPAPPAAAQEKEPAVDGALLAPPAGDAGRARGGGGLEAAPLRRDAEGRVVAVVETTGDARRARAAVTAAGGRLQREAPGGVLRVAVPESAVRALARVPGVTGVRTPHPISLHGDVTEGVTTTGAHERHAEGLRGAGVTVAVVDGGFKGLAASQASGDLPPDLVVEDMCPNLGVETTEHGTAVAEIVHDMAPDATLQLICVEDDTDLAAAAASARDRGATVVNFSAGFTLTGRGDGSGGPSTPAGVVRRAREEGVLWVASAGNEADVHWTGSFDDPQGDDYHDFVPGDEENSFAVPAGGTAMIDLRWDDWPLSDQDFDFFVVDESGHAIDGAWSFGLQDGRQPPIESVVLKNTSTTTQTASVVIARDGATARPRFDLFVHGATGLEHVRTDGSVTEPATSPYAVGVGASCWADGEARFYSSRGPTVDGRVKPDLNGPAGVTTKAYGASSQCTGFGFEGTSASAPHVTGAVALLKQAHPDWGPARLQDQLSATAADAGPEGRDNTYGSGNLRVDVVARGVTGACPPEVVGEDGFVDVPPENVHEAAVDCIFHWGVARGTGPGTYSPALAVTRGQMATFIANAVLQSGGALEESPKDAFRDDDGSPHERSINRLAAAGIVSGRADGTYGAGSPVTRAQMATFLVAAWEHRTGRTLRAGSDRFQDDDGSVHEAAIDAAAEAGLVQGAAPGRYEPSRPVRRDQMGSFVARLLGRLVDEGHTSVPREGG